MLRDGENIKADFKQKKLKEISRIRLRIGTDFCGDGEELSISLNLFLSE
jgi:Zn finger protein HypA/HybF involved in hydrogenase expression